MIFGNPENIKDEKTRERYEEAKRKDKEANEKRKKQTDEVWAIFKRIKEMPNKVFLDDVRAPYDCASYMHRRIGNQNPMYLLKDWIIVKNYKEFCDHIEKTGIPDIISFDHDLAYEHYEKSETVETLAEYYNKSDREMTGYDCAKWLVDYWILKSGEEAIKFPEYVVHSMNTAGTENIISYLENFKKVWKI